MIRKRSVSELSVEYVKLHKRELVELYAGNAFPSSLNDTPVTVFMAGSPGAGKTEFSKGLINEVKDKTVRIDADDIREFIPYYNGKNSDLVQGAASIGVEKLYDFVLKERKNVIVDGTFMNYKKSASNVKRALDKGRKVEIYYIYQEPLLAWSFAKVREELEGRRIPKDAFIEAFLLAPLNVSKAKELFGDHVSLHVVVKDYSSQQHHIDLDVNSVDEVISMNYDTISLQKLLT